eukprot:gnl/TRDRNA2_/TRDRNA2_153051_c0_seq4.p1 gnl/TRDRNA2_/TRDRNA2_153051_c0~~gnl/TRDRNA2_/TRDRNA2_153051_c0_seq4.p1  ORF type:complete len:186 (-),score=14.04 gnl/TRDRNA2_/TRDRNA2_153051_c0_seq4:375-932(-)
MTNRTRHACLESWKRASDALVGSLSWEELETAYVQFRTRSHTLKDGTRCMIPGIDFVNTAERSSINTQENFEVNSDVFVVQAAHDLHAGSELYTEYCLTCVLDSNGTSLSLFKATANALDLASTEPPKAPRCHDAILASVDQGPLHCSLARLTWERCAEKWWRKAPRQKHHGPSRPVLHTSRKEL